MNKFLCFLVILFLFSCTNENIKVEIPRRHKNITNKAQWYGGLDGGMWFNLSKLNEKEYRIETYLESGDKHWDAIFITNKNGFHTEKPYEYVYPADYSKCAIKQGNEIYTLIFKEDYKSKK